VLGLLAGTPAKAFLVIFLASLFGTLASIRCWFAPPKPKMHLPFGPYLCWLLVSLSWGLGPGYMVPGLVDLNLALRLCFLLYLWV